MDVIIPVGIKWIDKIIEQNKQDLNKINHCWNPIFEDNNNHILDIL